MAFRAAERMGRDAAVSVVNKVLVLSVALPALAVGAGIPGIALAQVLGGGAAFFTARALYPGINGRKLSVSRQAMRAMVLGGLPLLSMSVSGAAQPYWMPSSSRSWLRPRRSVTLEPPETSSARCWYRPSSWGPPPIRASPGRRTTRPRSLARCGVRCALCSGSGPSARPGTLLFAETAVGLIYGPGFAPAATILKVYAPALFLVFIDMLLGNTLYAAGVSVGFAVVLAVKVLVSAGLNLVLVPIVQARTGNGGIGVVLSFALSELVVLSGVLVLMPRGTLTRAAAVDTARALGAAGLTLLLFWALPSLNPWLGIPLCIATFSGASWLLGLMRQRDVEAIRESSDIAKARGPTLRNPGLTRGTHAVPAQARRGGPFAYTWGVPWSSP